MKYEDINTLITICYVDICKIGFVFSQCSLLNVLFFDYGSMKPSLSVFSGMNIHKSQTHWIRLFELSLLPFLTYCTFVVHSLMESRTLIGHLV